MKFTGKNSIRSRFGFISSICAGAIRDINEQEAAAIKLIDSVVVSSGETCYRITPVDVQVVSINNATTAELQSLSRVGPALAARLIAARPFDSFNAVNKVVKCDLLSANQGRIALNDLVVVTNDISLAWSKALDDVLMFTKQRLIVEQAADDSREAIRKLMMSARDQRPVPPRLRPDVQRLLRLPATCSAEDPRKRTWRSKQY